MTVDNILGGLRRWRRRRDLASTTRAGRYARTVAWERHRAFLRLHWRALAGVFAATPMAFAPLAVLEHGGFRWATVGASVATGFWLVVLVTVLAGGAGSQLMGLIGEGWTLDELRPALRQGWRLVNGLRLRPLADIDHVMVGPAGALVVETKWSSREWPSMLGGHGFMDHQLADAIDQTRRNRGDVASHFKRDLAGAPTQAVLVLWSAVDAGLDHPLEADGVTVVPGRRLRAWFDGQTGKVMDSQTVEAAWQALDKQARIRDEKDLESAVRPPTSLRQAFWEWVVQPFIGVVTSVYLLGILYRSHDWRIEGVGTALSLVAGIGALGTQKLRRVALGWAAVTGFMTPVVIVAGVASAIR